MWVLSREKINKFEMCSVTVRSDKRTFTNIYIYYYINNIKILHYYAYKYKCK